VCLLHTLRKLWIAFSLLSSNCMNSYKSYHAPSVNHRCSLGLYNYAPRMIDLLQFMETALCWLAMRSYYGYHGYRSGRRLFLELLEEPFLPSNVRSSTLTGVCECNPFSTGYDLDPFLFLFPWGASSGVVETKGPDASSREAANRTVSSTGPDLAASSPSPSFAGFFFSS